MQESQHSAAVLVRAVQYVRMSTEHQRFSISAQKAVIAEYAHEHGYEIVDTYADPGKSGLSLKGRKELQRLLADVLGTGRTFDAVLILDVSRWGRFQDPDQAAHYEFICRQAGVEVTYCAEPFASDPNPFTALIKQLKRVMAGEYSRELSAKVSRARLQHARLGFYQGGGPVYGFRRQVIGLDGTPGRVLQPGMHKDLHGERLRMVPGPSEEIGVIRKIFDLYVRRKWSRAEIVRYLRQRNIPGNRGQPWTTAMLYGVLTNELCIGRYVHNRKTQKLQSPSRRNPEALWVRTTIFPPIISERVFKRAQERLHERRPKPLPREQMLKGLRDLWVEKGRLSTTIVDRSRSVPSARTYVLHFGSFQQALKEIGYVAPMVMSGPERAWSEEDLRTTLRRIYDAHGYLSVALMDNDPDLPTVATLRQKIGNLSALYKFIGVPPKTQAEILRESNARGGAKMRGRRRKRGVRRDWNADLLIGRLKRLLAQKTFLSGPLIDADPMLPCARTVKEHFGSLMNAYQAAGWNVDRSAVMRLKATRARSKTTLCRRIAANRLRGLD